MKSNVPEWRKLESRTLFEGGPQGRIRLTVDQAVRPDGVTTDYPHVVAPDSVRVLAVHRGRIPVVTQHHYLHGEITDLPGGLVDPGETPEQAARRELSQETGLRAAWLRRLGVVAASRATSTEKIHLFLVHGCTPGAAAPEAGEAVEVGWRSWHELARRDPADVFFDRPLALADAASLAAVQCAGALLETTAGPLPADGTDLIDAAWSAYSLAAMRDPIADDRLTLVWLDLAVSRLAECVPVLDELASAVGGPGSEEAWQRAAERFRDLADPATPAAP